MAVKNEKGPPIDEAVPLYVIVYNYRTSFDDFKDVYLFALNPSIIGIDGTDEYRRFEEIGASAISLSCESTEIGHQLPVC